MTQKLDLAKIAVLVGSLRKESFNRKAAHALMALAPDSLALEIVELGALSMYNQGEDEAGKPPSAWRELRQKIKAMDGVLFITPEYNRSVPAVLKNAIDIGSRPYGQSAWDGKPAAVVSVSPGAIGGFGANHHLRQSLVFLNMPTLQQPELYLGGAAKLFGPDGTVTDDSARALLQKFITTYAQWVQTHRAAK